MAEDCLAGRQAVSRHHVLARSEHRSGVCQSKLMLRLSHRHHKQKYEIHSWEADILCCNSFFISVLWFTFTWEIVPTLHTRKY